MKQDKKIIGEESDGIKGITSSFPVWARESFRDFRDVIMRERSLRLMGILCFFVLILAVILWLVESHAAFGKNEASYVDSFWKALYLSFISGTTTGYGDLIPHTSVGRVLTAIIIVIGMVLTSVLTAAIASWFVEKAVVGG